MAYQPARPSGFGLDFTLTPWVRRLMIANAGVFVLMLITGRGGQQFLMEWFAFVPNRVLTRPWGALTYMFLHAGFWHIFFNMLMLFFFGPPLEQRWGSREFIRYYLICGLGGVALSFLFVSNPIIGASAAVYGVMLAFAMNWPDSPIYIWGIFPIKAKWLVGFMFVVSFYSAFNDSGGNVAHFAHLGGFAAGLLYLKSDWRVSNRIERLKKATRQRRFAIVPREEDGDGAARREAAGGKRPGRAGRMQEQEEEALLDAVDRVLDKISESGIGSLTAEERRLLDEVSRRSRTN
jgi:membrane associated rhomboid family serine protease